jgi:multicomponent Na+:H+ antiporter subunit E
MLFVALFVFWLLLSGAYTFHSAIIFISGLASCALVTWLATRMKIADEEGLPSPNVIWRFLLYMPWLLKEIAVANIDVARRVWSVELRIAPRMIEVPCETKTAVGTVIYANSITLTPGTVTVRAKPDSFLVHALSEEAAEALLTGEMHERVLRVESGEAPKTADKTAADEGDADKAGMVDTEKNGDGNDGENGDDE